VYFVHRFIAFRGRGVLEDETTTWQGKLTKVQTKQEQFMERMKVGAEQNEEQQLKI
jgi:hypothetical protein